MILKNIILEKKARENQIFNSDCVGAGDYRVLAWCNEKISKYKSKNYVLKMFKKLNFIPETKKEDCKNLSCF